MQPRGRNIFASLFAVAGAASCAGPAPALAERIDNQVAVFTALDKVTALTSSLEVPLGESRAFGALKVTPRACYSRPAAEQPKTVSFVEIDEITLEGQEKRIFTGWMFAENPGVNALAHPIFDVWLTGCDKPRKSLARRAPSESGSAPENAGYPDAAPDGGEPDDPFGQPRRRIRR